MRGVLLIVAAALAGCSTAHQIRGKDGEPLVMIQCGASTSFSVCYERAAKECPGGYKTVSEEPGFNRKTIKIACQ